MIDLSEVCKEEDVRQELISKQKGDGLFNFQTGVYKWGSDVYDLTKTNGEIGIGWMPIRGKILKYKTIDENKVLINPPQNKNIDNLLINVQGGVIRSIERLILRTPNDTELGKAVREMFSAEKE